jgi:hypothetical protein
MQPESLRSDFIIILPRWLGSITSTDACMNTQLFR